MASEEVEEGPGLEGVEVVVTGPWITGTWGVTREDSSSEVQVHQTETGSETHQGGCLEDLGLGIIEVEEDLNDRTTEISQDNLTPGSGNGRKITRR